MKGASPQERMSEKFQENEKKTWKKERKNSWVMGWVKLFRSGIEIGKIFKSKKTPDGIIKILDPKQFKKHWVLLDKIEERLRIEADSKGMLMTNKDDPGTALK